VPNENSSTLRKDYWSILRRKLYVFSTFDAIKGIRAEKAPTRRAKVAARVPGIILPVLQSDLTNHSDHTMLRGIPVLKPFYSYHIRIEYSSKYQNKLATSINFKYEPILGESVLDSVDKYGPDLTKTLSLRAFGYVYRPLELHPPLLDFGVVPCGAETSVIKTVINYGVISNEDAKQHGKLDVQALNLSFGAKNLSLRSISPEFSTKECSWSVAAGMKLVIPFDFHPVKEQVECRGEAVFEHDYGIIVIKLAGTGASADVQCDDDLFFGSVKYGSIVRRKLCIFNQGKFENINIRPFGHAL
jgi:hypothetical protein